MFKPLQKVSREQLEFEDRFIREMFELGLYNSFDDTYSLDIKETSYGYSGRIFLKPGLSFSHLETKRGDLQGSLSCIWIMEPVPFSRYAKLKIVTKPMNNKLPYANPGIKANEFYLGVDFMGNPLKCDVNQYCMFLLAGATGSGKTRYLYQVLLSWILGCKVNEIEIWLSDIAKNEYNLFKHVKHVRAYAEELSELYQMCMCLREKMDTRKKVIAPLREAGIATNIEEYNKTQKHKMSYVYLVIDEFSVINIDKTDSQEEREYKEAILDTIKRISKIGRSLGIFTVICTQKTVKDELPSVVKNMSAVRISFKANDDISSQVIMGDDSAVGLAERYAVYSLNGGSRKDYFFSTYLSTEMLKEMLEPHIDRKRSKINLRAYSQRKQVSEKIRKEQDRQKIVSINSHYKTINLAEGEAVDYR